MNYKQFRIKSITLDQFKTVTIADPDGGRLKDQSVQSVLLFLILHELREMNKRESEPEPL